MYRKPSSTSGVDCSRACALSPPGSAPPSCTTKATCRFLTLDWLIWSSGEKRLASYVLWLVSQLPGSLSAFFSRSKVTSAAVRGDDNKAAITPPVAAPNKPRVERLTGLCSKRLGIVSPSLNGSLLFPAGGHLLAAHGTLTEIFLAIGNRRRAFADDLGLEIRDDRLDLALLQPCGRWRRLLVADILGGHAVALFALRPGKLVEMRHRGPAGDAAADDLD